MNKLCSVFSVAFLANLTFSPAAEYEIKGHILSEPTRNNTAFFTNRLIALPANEERIQNMGDLLNQITEDGQLNGMFYESGEKKDLLWIQKKRDLLLGNLEKGLVNTRFFYLKNNPEKLVCFVGAELSYFDESPDALVPFWGTDLNFQGKGLTSEALRGFVLADILRDPAFTSLIISIHPANVASAHLAEHVLNANKVRDGMNHSKTQPRAFYEVSTEKLTIKSEGFPAISWAS